MSRREPCEGSGGGGCQDRDGTGDPLHAPEVAVALEHGFGVHASQSTSGAWEAAEREVKALLGRC
jgi:hypothetical protein